MIENILIKIEEIVRIIYTPDLTGFQEAYLSLLDAFSEFLTDMDAKGYIVDINKELQSIQEAMNKNDRVLLADILLYTIKPDFISLREEMNA